MGKSKKKKGKEVRLKKKHRDALALVRSSFKVKKIKRKPVLQKSAKSKKVSGNKKGRRDVGKETKYNRFQRVLQEYCEKNNIKLGSEFNKVAGRLWKDIKASGFTWKHIGENIAQLLKQYGRIKAGYGNIPDGFAFYNAMKELASPDMISGVDIKVLPFHDPLYDFSSEGFGSGSGGEFGVWFRNSDIMVHLRTYYNNESPAPSFKIRDTDGEKWVNYEVVLGEVSGAAPPGGGGDGVGGKEGSGSVSEKHAAAFKVLKELDIEMEKQKQVTADKVNRGKELDIEMEKQKQVTADKVNRGKELDIEFIKNLMAMDISKETKDAIMKNKFGG